MFPNKPFEEGLKMDKKKILKFKDYMFNKIVNFGEYYKNENIDETSYSEWNARDVIGHINSWIKFSEDKLEAIKLKKSFEDIKNEFDVERLNKTNYEKNKNKPLEMVINESKIILEKYEGVLNLFEESELLSDKLPIGFSCTLWKYMAMDLGIHPLQHILYQYLKKRDYKEFIKEIENSKKYFMEYSDNNIKEYNFNGLYENKEEKEKRFNELKEEIKDKNNELVEKIIKINME